MNARFRRAGILAVLILSAALTSAAQTPATPPSSQAATGLEAPWDVRNIIAAIMKDNEELKTVIVGLNPQRWYEQKGAPSTYIPEWTTAQHQVNDVVIASRVFSQNTESLSLALDTYFRLEALETSARSLAEGAHQYGDRAKADKLSELVGRNFSSRERFRDYLRDLATSKEQAFKIADQEAQRCRGMISKEPATKPARRSNRN